MRLALCDHLKELLEEADSDLPAQRKLLETLSPACIGGWPSRQEQAAATQQFHKSIEEHGWDAMRQRLEQAQLFPATDAPSSTRQVPAPDLLSAAGKLPTTDLLSSAGQVPATLPLSSAGQLPTTNPLSSAGQLPANSPSPSCLPSSAAGHVGSARPGLPCSPDASSAAASSVPATKAQSPAASEREVLQTSQPSQLQAARPSMPALPIAPQPQLQLQAQRRSSLAPAQLQPQTLSCPSLPSEMTQQPTGTTAVALTHPEQPIGTTAETVIHPEQPVGAIAVAVVHPEQQHVVSTGSLIAAVQAPTSAQVRPSQAIICISTIELLSHSHSSLSGDRSYILRCCSVTHSCGAAFSAAVQVPTAVAQQASPAPRLTTAAASAPVTPQLDQGSLEPGSEQNALQMSAEQALLEQPLSDQAALRLTSDAEAKVLNAWQPSSFPAAAHNYQLALRPTETAPDLSRPQHTTSTADAPPQLPLPAATTAAAAHEAASEATQRGSVTAASLVPASPSASFDSVLASPAGTHPQQCSVSATVVDNSTPASTTVVDEHTPSSVTHAQIIPLMHAASPAAASAGPKSASTAAISRLGLSSDAVASPAASPAASPTAADGPAGEIHAGSGTTFSSAVGAAGPRQGLQGSDWDCRAPCGIAGHRPGLQGPDRDASIAQVLASLNGLPLQSARCMLQTSAANCPPWKPDKPWDQPWEPTTAGGDLCSGVHIHNVVSPF